MARLKCVKPGETEPYRPGVAVLSGHTGHVIFGDPIDPDEFASGPELLNEVRMRITTLEVAR